MHYDPMVARIVAPGENCSAALIKLKVYLSKFQDLVYAVAMEGDAIKLFDSRSYDKLLRGLDTIETRLFPMCLLNSLLIMKWLKQESSSLGRVTSAYITVVAFLIGVLCSGIARYTGMCVFV